MNSIEFLEKIFGHPLDECFYDFEKNIDEVISTLNEREQCIIKKRLRGEKFKAIGLSLIRMDRNEFQTGISTSQAVYSYNKAFRKLRHPSRRKVFSGEWKAEDFFRDTLFKEQTQDSITPERIAKSEELKTVHISTISLSIRSFNALTSAGINTLGDLILKTEEELLSIKNFGRKSLYEIKETLLEMDLSLVGSQSTKIKYPNL